MQGTDLQFTYVDDRGPETLDLSFSLYRQKIPDTAVYANSKTNAALSEWSTAGGDPCKGEGWQYMRFRLNAVCGFAPTDILSADFHTRRLEGSGDPQSLQMYYAEGQWSSMNMLWGNRYAANVALEDSRGKQTGDELCFTVTDFVKRAFGDPEWLVESNGLVLRGGDYGTEGYQTVATSDHALYTPYIRIRSVKPPMYLDKDAGMG